MNFFGVGDGSICVDFGPKIDEELNQKAINLAVYLEQQEWPEILEIVPAYSSVTIYFNPLKFNYLKLIERVKRVINLRLDAPQFSPKNHSIPVVYGGEYGPDLQFVADFNRISSEEVVQTHTQNEFRVFMLGFMPGFPYCGIVPPKIRAPRLASPRTRVPAGSVGIAAAQTGIYPLESPGGWRIIGRTPVKLFDPNSDRKNMFRFNPGDRIRFYSITAEEFHDEAH